MRILRGKSSLEVSSHGFAWFVVGLVIATFIGGAVRTILTSDRVHRRIVSELRARFPQADFQIGATEVILSRGLWPGLGLRVRDLSFRQDLCGKLSYAIEVPQAVLPVDLFALRKGKMRLGRVELSNGTVHLNYKPCPEEKSAAAATASASSAPKKPMLSAPSLNWNKVSEHLNAIDLSHFTVTYERNVTWKILIPSMQFDFGGDLSAQGTMEIQKAMPFGALSHTVELEAQGDERVLIWSLQSEFKEGFGQVRGSLDLGTNLGQITVNARQLPMKDVANELHLMGFVERDLKLKAAWLSCELKWEGPIEKLEAAPVLAHDCKIEGGYGRVDLAEAEVWLDHPKELKKPVQLKVTKLQMQAVLEALGREVLPKVLARPGFWSGDLRYLNPNDWGLDGHLESVEVVFSNRSVRGKQALEKLRTQVSREAGKIRATVDQLEIRGGEFAGALHFSLQDDWRNGEFRAAVEKLRFGPNIQMLMVGGTLGNLRFDGRGTLKDGELGAWMGDFDLESLAGAGWSVQNLAVKSKYEPGVFKLEGRAKSGTLLPQWSFYPQLQAVRPDTSGAVHFREIQAKVDIMAAGGQISSITASEEERRAPWRLKGSWVRDGEFLAALNVGANKPRAYTLTGEKGTLSVDERLR